MRAISPRTAVPVLLLSAASLQGGAAFAKMLFPALGANGATGLRVLLAALLVLIFFRPSLRGLSAAQWAALLPYGASLGMMNLAFYLALERIPLGLAVTLEFVGPLAVALWGSRRPADFLWVILAGIGIILLAPWSGAPDAVDGIGALLALAAGACWAVYIVVGGKVGRMIPSGGVSVTAGLLVATASVLPFSASPLLAADYTLELLGIGLAVALLSSAIPYTLEMVALRSLPARTFGILMSLEPAVAALIGLLFLREHLTATQWLAVVAVCAASAGSTMTSERPAAGA